MATDGFVVSAGGWNSYAPTSCCATASASGPSARLKPRWSFAGADVAVPLSTAGLVEPIERVIVGPPLAASAPRSGSVLLWLPFAVVKPQVVPLSMLLAVLPIVPLH